jgi:hypothetical protein
MATNNKRPPSPESSPVDGFSKRGKAQDDIETIKLVPKAQAWDFDIGTLLDLPTHVLVTAEDNNANNFRNYRPSESLFILCVTGTLDVGYQMLWYVSSFKRLYSKDRLMTTTQSADSQTPGDLAESADAPPDLVVRARSFHPYFAATSSSRCRGGWNTGKALPATRLAPSAGRWQATA